MNNYDIFDDYAAFKAENDKLINTLVKNKSKTISRFTPVIAVVDYLYCTHCSGNNLSEDELLIFSTGFDYIYDQFLFIDTLLKNNYNNDYFLLERNAITINLLLYIHEFQAEALNYKDKKITDKIKLLDDLEETVFEYLNENKNVDEEYFGILDDICNKIFEQNNIEIHTIDEIFYEIAIEYNIYSDEEYDIYNNVINQKINENK